MHGPCVCLGVFDAVECANLSALCRARSDRAYAYSAAMSDGANDNAAGPPGYGPGRAVPCICRDTCLLAVAAVVSTASLATDGEWYAATQ